MRVRYRINLWTDEIQRGGVLDTDSSQVWYAPSYKHAREALIEHHRARIETLQRELASRIKRLAKVEALPVRR